MAQIEVMNPVAVSAEFRVTPAKRLDDLADKTIGLYWNAKVGGEVALAHISELLQRRFPSLRFKSYIGAVGGPIRQATTEQLDRIARECDAAIGTSAD